MKGHTGIINMRKSGRRPESVFLCDFPTATDWERYGDYPTVDVSADAINGLDLRFLVGLRVHVSGLDDDRTRALIDACKWHGAQTVIGAGARRIDKWRFETTWVDVWHKS